MTEITRLTDRNEPQDRQLKVLERRLTRLEETQLTGREVNLLFDLIAEKVETVEDQIERRIDWLEARLDRLEARVEERFNKLERKLDLAIWRSRDSDRISDD